ncbi:sensor histidine kinase [Amycolatopsis sp. K13G38]|uniref:Sensor histidine kinase n=1 Tax=Amycolatopsis acididurans TaxID=2724524 RepID=A0ABX1J910_9PSEU|nr:sensor histidine kinase [Amycolatopsis acididurans]NKQ56283.1 sensor histidine kinase [Amycolatopsis acididurans]
MASEPGFTHSALIVDSPDALAARLVPLLERQMAEERPVLLVVAPETEDLVRAELGARAERLEWGQRSGFYQQLGVAFERFRRYLADQRAAGRRVHVVAEPLVTGDRATAYLPYEAVCNDAFAAYDCPVTCLWDSRRHPASHIEDVRRVHGWELGETEFLRSGTFVPAGTYLAGFARTPLPQPPPATLLDRLVLDVHDLPRLRERTRFLAQTAGTAAEDVTLAVNEVVTNGLLHGEPPVRIRAWPAPGALIVQIEDAGGVEVPPAAGYLPPDVDQYGGRGMWLARQLADIVTTHTSGDRTAVRMSFPS